MREVQWATPFIRIKEQVNAPQATLPFPSNPLGNLGAGEWQLIVWNLGTERTVETLRAKKFVELVEEEGLSPTAAAETLQTSLVTLRRTRGQVEASVQAVLDSHGWMVPDLKKAYVRARQLQVMDMALEAVEADPTDAKMLKILLDATKLVGDDKEVNLYEKKVVAAPVMTQPALPPGLAALVSGVEVNPELIEEDEKEND